MPATPAPPARRADPAQTRSTVLLAWLWRAFLKKRLPLLMVALVFMVIEGSTLGAISYMMQPMFDYVFVERNTDALGAVALVIFAIFLVRAFSGMVQKLILTRISVRTVADLRLTLLNRLIQQDGAFHMSHPPGYLLQRMQTDIDTVNLIWRILVTGAGRDVISVVVLMGVAISIDWRWAAIACIGLPVIMFPVYAAQRYVRRKARKARDVGATLASRLDEIFHGIVQVKLNRLEDYQKRRYRAQTKRFMATQTRGALGSAAIPGLVDIMGGMGFVCVLLFGGAEIIAGEKTVGQFVSFLTAMGLAFNPLRRLGKLSALWQTAAAAIERVKALIEEPIRLTSPANPVQPPVGIPRIELSAVSLRYGDTPVLRNLTLTAEAGKTTALVGPSGAGKSTVFNVLTRLVDPQEGQVRIGGIDAATMSLDDLRGLFSVVSQDALLFNETLRENILLGRTDVSDAQLRAVLDAAHVSDFLPALDDGLDTRVGPRGSALSGGQRQRVVIARAILRDTPILLLDEATSALDAQAEKVVQEALDRLSGGRTTLVIAHRLATVRNADKIIVMDRGAVVDEGTHEALLARGGIYADLYALQFQADPPVIDRAGRAAAS